MKKIFTSAAILLAFGFTAIGITSCNSDNDIISTIINTIFGQNGETYTYNLTHSKAVAFAELNEQGETNLYTDTTSFSNQQVTLACSKNFSGQITAQLNFPEYNWESIQVKNLTLANLVITTTNDISTLSIGDNTTIDGSFTYGGKTYTAFYCEFEQAQVTTNEVYIKGYAQFGTKNAQGETDFTNYQQLSFELKGTIVAQQ